MNLRLVKLRRCVMQRKHRHIKNTKDNENKMLTEVIIFFIFEMNHCFLVSRSINQTCEVCKQLIQVSCAR